MAEAAVKGLAFPEHKKRYIVEVLDPLLEQMVHALLAETPSRPVEFMLDWLRRRQGGFVDINSKQSLLETNEAMKKDLNHMKEFMQDASVAVGSKPTKDEEQSEEEEEEDDDEGEEMPMPPPPVNRGHRQSVSAEAYGAWNQEKKGFTPPVHHKTEEQTERLRSILSKSFLFSCLEKKDLDVVILAMVEKNFAAESKIITEGEDGDHLYVIEEGSPVCKKRIDGEDKVVKQCTPGDVFGELALLYNAPRAASVEATDDCKCWQLDRETFSHIVQSAATKSREQHDGFLQKVSIFSKMEAYERSQICDALKVEHYKKGDLVVKEKDQGHTFYIVEEGSLQAEKGAEGTVVMEYGSGDCFGELALLKNQPRAASVRITSPDAKVLSLDRKAFVKLLGPVKELLARKEQDYNRS